MTQTGTFEGFEQSNTTPVPDIFFDVLLADLSGAEVKVLLYIIRRTRGFKKDSDAISLTQFEKGIKTKDGKQLDRGCGLSRETIAKALVSLEEKHCITSTKKKTDYGDSDTTVYSIYFKPDSKPVKKTTGSRKIRPQVVGKSDRGRSENPTTGSRKIRPQVVGKSDPQHNSNTTNSTQQTVIQQSNTPNVVANETSGVAIAAANQTSETTTSNTLFPVEEKPEPEKKPRNTAKAKLARLEQFNLEQEATIDNIMLLGDCLRGNPLPAIKRADSDYQKALLTGATPLSNRKRKDGYGYTLKEISAAWLFFKRIAPEGKPWLIADDWWKDKNVDLWVVAKNIDKALAAMEKLEREHGNAPAPEEKKPTPINPDKLVWWTKYSDHEGDPISNWFLYEKMPLSEAMKDPEYEFLSLPSGIAVDIETFYGQLERGERQLPKDIPPYAPANFVRCKAS